jgi:predicted porin
LSGNFGDVRVGTHESLAKMTTEMIDPLAGVALTGVFAQSGLPTTRPTNSITYLSPRASGFQVQAQYDEGESNTSTTVGKDNYASAVAVNYVAGPFTAMVSMENRKNVGYAAAAALVDIVGDDILVPGAASGAATSVDKVNHKAYGATYTVAGVKLAAMATELKYTDSVADNNGKIKSNLLGATVPVGTNMVVYASVSDGEIVDAGVKTHDIKGYQLVGQYNLSKRTNAYVALGQSKYDSPTANADIEINQAAIGLRHSF